MVRLESQKTDLLMVINVPHVSGSYDEGEVDPASGKHGRLLEQGMDLRGKVLESFQIKDWGLFVQEE